MEATITLRTTNLIKTAAQERADALGISLSTVLNNALRHFVNGAPVIINDDSALNLLEVSKEVDQDYANQRNLTEFHNKKDALTFLDQLISQTHNAN